MIWTVVGMTQQDEYFRGPFWVSLPYSPAARPIILGVSDRDDERSDYAKFCAKYGEHHQFFLLNDDAIEGCNAASIKLKILGSTEYEDLRGEPTVLLGTRPERKSA
jgi:hypothetical protein